MFKNVMSKEEIMDYLDSSDPAKLDHLFSDADRIRKERCGDGVLLRGLVEFSNVCGKNCSYCGLNNKNNNIQRYKMTSDEIIGSVEHAVLSGIKTVVLQSGEDPSLDPYWLAQIVKEIKYRYGIAVTLSVGEKSFEQYKLWKDSGADRYLLKIETTNPAIYSNTHGGETFDNRKRCLEDLKRLNYQVGSGILIGLPGQTTSDIADDILFFVEKDFDMIGIGPFIPHKDTLLGNSDAGSIDLTLRTIALVRINCAFAHLPSTTALGSLYGDNRIKGLKAGANVLMPNFTPQHYKKAYEIYPNKRCIDEAQGACAGCMESMAAAAGRKIDLSIGHSLKSGVGSHA